MAEAAASAEVAVEVEAVATAVAMVAPISTTLSLSSVRRLPVCCCGNEPKATEVN